MRFKKSNLPLIAVFIGTVIYTWFGILEMGKQGGPCNAGLALIILVPTLAICVTAQAVSLRGVSKTGADKIVVPIVLSGVSFLF